VLFPSSGSALVTTIVPPVEPACANCTFARRRSSASVTWSPFPRRLTASSGRLLPRTPFGRLPITGAPNHSSASRLLRMRSSRLSRAKASTSPSSSPSPPAIARFRPGRGDTRPGSRWAGSNTLVVTGATLGCPFACCVAPPPNRSLTSRVNTLPVSRRMKTDARLSLPRCETSSTELSGREETCSRLSRRSREIRRPRSRSRSGPRHCSRAGSSSSTG